MVEQITQLFAIEALILTSLVATSFTGAEREREKSLCTLQQPVRLEKIKEKQQQFVSLQ